VVRGRRSLPGTEEFAAKVEAADRGGAFVRVPPDVVASLGGRSRIPVRATFDGVPYRGSIVTMGGEKVLGLLRSIRTQLGKGPGDVLTVSVEVDDDARSVDVPEDLRAALDRAGQRERFDELSYSHRREYVLWIEEAKKPATRARRIDETIERLGQP
jgi:Bacteriocin-protection, YdeI or OmpD-Associated/Domain of unknown function (DUF1905)